MSPDNRTEHRLNGEETVDFNQPTERPQIPGVECQDEIVEIRKQAIPKQGRPKLRVGFRIEAR